MDDYLKALRERNARQRELSAKQREQLQQLKQDLEQAFSVINIANPILKDVCEVTVAAESQERCSDDIQQLDGIILEGGGSHFRHSI